jgi:hypothetical protein
MKMFITINRGVWSIFLAAMVMAFAAGAQEPEFQGRLLSSWVDDLNYFYFINPDSQKKLEPKQEAAIKAIRQIGTNAIPFALELLKARAPIQTNAPKLELLYPQSPEADSARRRHSQFAQKKWERGWCIFHALGPIAKPAIPTLIEGIHRSSLDGTHFFHVYMSPLAAIGDDVVPVLIELLKTGNSLERAWMAQALGSDSFRSQTPIIIPALQKALNDSDPVVRNRAKFSLYRVSEGKLP